MKLYNVKLTLGELNHLLTLLERNVLDGTHNAPRDQYWARHGRCVSKLEGATNESMSQTLGLAGQRGEDG